MDAMTKKESSSSLNAEIVEVDNEGLYLGFLSKFHEKIAKID